MSRKNLTRNTRFGYPLSLQNWTKTWFRRYRRTATMTKSRVWGGSGHGPTRRNSAAVGVPFLVVFVVATLWSGGARAVSDNLLKIACDDMTPRHPGFKSENVQHVANPYRLVVDGPVVPGNLVNVTLSSANGSTPFKGFMVQARDADGHMLGTFLPDCQDGGNKSHHMITCSNGVEPYNTVVQSNNKIKTHETFTWVAPISLKGSFIFKYTVVLDFEHFWVNEETPEIQVVPISTEEYKIKSSMNHEYYIYKLYITNCDS